MGGLAVLIWTRAGCKRLGFSFVSPFRERMLGNDPLQNDMIDGGKCFVGGRMMTTRLQSLFAEGGTIRSPVNAGHHAHSSSFPPGSLIPTEKQVMTI